MKLTENRVDTLIDILNDLICDEQSITREQRENLIKTVATLGGLKERLRLISAEKGVSLDIENYCTLSSFFNHGRVFWKRSF